MAAPQLSDRLLTAEEFFELSDPPEGGKMELVCGKVVRHMPVSRKHARVVVVLTEAGHLLGRSPDVVLAPDVSFVANERIPVGGLPDDGFVSVVPTLAIEVVSPNDLDSEVAGKVDDYLAAGVKRVWVVRPRRATVTVFSGSTSRIIGAGGTLTSGDAGFTTDGFELPVVDLFS